MEASVGDGVGTQVESEPIGAESPSFGVHVRMLGSLAVVRHGVAQTLPTSRKSCALLAYLALAPHPVPRSELCDLLWDGPNDPRGELRWCLSKVRKLLDEPDCSRIETSGETIALDLRDCFVDALKVAALGEMELDGLNIEQLRALSALHAGNFLDGLEIDRSPYFTNWLLAQRRRFGALHISTLERLVAQLPRSSGEAAAYAEKWLKISALDMRAHIALLTNLASRGQFAACEEHLLAAARLFEDEGQSFGPVQEAWRAIRGKGTAVSASPDKRLAEIQILPAIEADRAAFILPRRASLAVMPFVEEGPRSSFGGGRADGLTHDIITRLAKLRDLFIIARGSVFALASQNIGPEEAGKKLNVDYVSGGTISYRTDRAIVSVELVEVRSARIVWAETFEYKEDDTFSVIDEIGDRIVASISSEIELTERNRAILKPPNSLDAWEAYHRGLWHMYRFTQAENALAQRYFERSIGLDPTFARAHAGLSFTHWQNAFQRWGDREDEGVRAFEAAGQSLLADDLNPAAHWAMGRALWLRNRQDESLGELGRAVDLSPNFALGHYALSFVHSQSGDPNAAIGSSDHSRHLSPFDPLLFGMLGARAMAHVRLGQFEEAAEWALKAAARPNAHTIILAIAAHCLALAGRVEEGRAFSSVIRSKLPHYCVNDFLTTFRFDQDAVARFRLGAQRIGLG